MPTGPKPSQRAAFFRELASLTAAGISVSQASRVLSQSWRDPAVLRAVQAMERGLAEGRTIADALAPSLDAMEYGILDAAERGGMLADGFAHLEQYHALRREALERGRAALRYPLFVLGAAVLLPAAVGAVLGQKPVVPALLGGLAWLAGLGLLAWLGWRWLSAAAARHPRWDQLLGWIPVLGPTREALALARWQAVMHFKIASSARISDGLRQAGAATGRARLVAASEAAAQAVEAGSELGSALLAQAAFPRSLAAGLASAEFTGTLDGETQRGAREWMARAAWLMESAPKRLAGAFYVGVLVFTAWQIYHLGQAYMAMYQQFADDLGL